MAHRTLDLVPRPLPDPPALDHGPVIDPHTHSSMSDGTEAPAELLRAAQRAGVDVLGLTDHDTWDGWPQAEAAVATTGVRLLRGVELSTSAGGVSVHLLAYLYDPADEAMLAMVARSRDSRLERARIMVDRLAVDYGLRWSEVLAQLEPGATVGRPHIADALVARGVVPDRSAAFADLLAGASPYYVPYAAPDVLTAIRTVRAAGGVPVVAHPHAGARGRVVPADVLGQMAASGLAGIEVDHRDHDDGDRQRLRELARSLGLLVTGASDYHGAGKPNRLAEHRTGTEVLAQILEQGRIGLVEP